VPRLDGIPLALELAATRVRALGVHELLARLDDRFRLLVTGPRDAPPRQQTLWAVIDWSWELLTEPERLVLRRLAVAADGCGLHAAEAICAEDDLDVLGLLARLVDRSLVVVADGPDGPRYRLLESVAAYGLQRLAMRGNRAELGCGTAVTTPISPNGRHHAFAATTSGPGSGAWTPRPPTCALPWTPRSRQRRRRFRMVNALAWYWFLRGRLTEARRALEQALPSGTDPPPPGPRPRPG
jgi:Predicted ATPase